MPQDQEQQMTLEQIEAHLQSSNLEQFNQQQPGAEAQDLSAQLKKVCGVYKAVKPVLQVVANFPLLPAAIKNAIKTFMSVLNTICP
jgi:hypothetical protein